FHAAATPCPPTLSLHDALPISDPLLRGQPEPVVLGHAEGLVEGVEVAHDLVAAELVGGVRVGRQALLGRLGTHPGAPGRCPAQEDRKSTRLNSSHVKISYAVFC